MKDRRASIVCSHVANGRPILRAVRDEPEMAEDSGWQFLCDLVGEENPETAQVWLVCEVLEKDFSLKSIINLPTGTIATRLGLDDPWVIE